MVSTNGKFGTSSAYSKMTVDRKTKDDQEQSQCLTADIAIMLMYFVVFSWVQEMEASFSAW